MIAITIVFFALLRNYIVSRHGTALRGRCARVPVLARSLGYSIPRLKLTAYVISALPAGAAGCLFAYQDGYVSDVSFGFSMAIAILAGVHHRRQSASIYGAVFGAAILVDRTAARHRAAAVVAAVLRTAAASLAACSSPAASRGVPATGCIRAAVRQRRPDARRARLLWPSRRRRLRSPGRR